MKQIINANYNYKEETEKIKRDKNITFYYDFDLDINDERQYKILPETLNQIDELEKQLSEAVNEKYSKNQKEEFIKLISEIIDRCFKKIKNKNLVDILRYRSSLKSKTRGLFVIVN